MHVHPLKKKVLKLLRKTIAVNRVVEKCTTVALDWSTPNTWDPTLCRAFDLVLAADVVYASNAAQPCAAAIDAVLGEHGVVLMAHQVRHAIYFDSKAGKVVKEAHDGPLELFRYVFVVVLVVVIIIMLWNVNDNHMQ